MTHPPATIRPRTTPRPAGADHPALFERVTTTGLEHIGRATIAVHRRLAALDPADPRIARPPRSWRGHGPVVLVGGFAATTPVLAPMVDWLTRLGYDVTPVTTGSGLGCAGRTVQGLGAEIAGVADAAGAPVRVIGHSRGGQFARVAARRCAPDVAALLTLGAPFDLYGLRLPMLAQAAALSTAGTLGVPNLATLSCLRGPCCATFRDELRAPWPASVAFTSAYSRSDRVVPWRSSHDPHARNVEIDTGHLGLLTAPAALIAVATALSGHDTPAPHAAA